jgi:hypothetical protein
MTYKLVTYNWNLQKFALHKWKYAPERPSMRDQEI